MQLWKMAVWEREGEAYGCNERRSKKRSGRLFLGEEENVSLLERMVCRGIERGGSSVEGSLAMLEIFHCVW
jgi:hypothetical protein